MPADTRHQLLTTSPFDSTLDHNLVDPDILTRMDVERETTGPLRISRNFHDDKLYEISDSTRKGVRAGIYISILLAIASLVASILVICRQNLDFGGSSLASQFFPLVLNVVISTCTDILSYTHSLSLRWALYKENRLSYNSNLRLFTSTKHCILNRWPINLLSAILLILSYTAANQAAIYNSNLPSNDSYLAWNEIALLVLAISFGGQISIAILCFYRARSVVWTWSPNAPNAALALLCEREVERKHRGPLQLTIDSSPISSAPKRQPSMASTYSQTRYIAWFLACMFVVSLGFAVLVQELTKSTNGEERVPWSFFADVLTERNGVVLVKVRTAYRAGRQILHLVMFLAGLPFQAFITLTLHCVELIINVSRDEAQWRAASSPKGATQW